MPATSSSPAFILTPLWPWLLWLYLAGQPLSHVLVQYSPVSKVPPPPLCYCGPLRLVDCVLQCCAVK